ncbi:hypothetical protein HYN48_11620 [Flavobacterium magnum]|uniref:Uncharacterized protein n=1 Tax=Flavobacterium magnum TaxID=2162713 RepID=A0A2S0RHT0_9FLAO|nr:hypothetical protein [Flavobacterium magnum]AWA30681.1 hypothetical protein HYN48_11620 [Flavobacterium magnum]
MKAKCILLLLLAASLSAHSQTFNTPVEYLNYIGKESANISKSTWKYMDAVAHSKRARKINNTREALVKTIQAAATKIRGLKDGYKGDVEYRDQVLAYLSFSENMIQEEYGRVIDMQEVAEQSYDYMEAYILLQEKINEKFSVEIGKINAAQDAFGLKYQIQMSGETSELGKKIKLSNEVFDNRSKLYLLFFKVNFTESSMMKALEAKDLTAVQQNANAMAQYAAEGLESLKIFKPYKNDPMLVNASKKYFEFAQKESSEYVPKVAAFMMLNQKFEDSKKLFDAKSDSQRTKEDIAQFNKLVDEFNKGINEYNKVNSKYNTDRSTNIQNWEITADNFVAKHVPAG